MFINIVNFIKKKDMLVARWTIASATDWLLMILSTQNWEQLRIQYGWSKTSIAGHLNYTIESCLISTH
jgi:hypothetical protein